MVVRAVTRRPLNLRYYVLAEDWPTLMWSWRSPTPSRGACDSRLNPCR